MLDSTSAAESGFVGAGAAATQCRRAATSRHGHCRERGAVAGQALWQRGTGGPTADALLSASSKRSLIVLFQPGGAGAF